MIMLKVYLKLLIVKHFDTITIFILKHMYYFLLMYLKTLEKDFVFEKYLKTCMQHYQLDPAHYLSAPGLAWDACLKETGQKLELLSDYDMLVF